MLIAFTLPALLAFAQGGNPFDLEYRKSKPVEESTGTGLLSVLRNRDTIARMPDSTVSPGKDEPGRKRQELTPVEGNPFDLRPGEGLQEEKEYEAVPEMPRVPETLANKGESGTFLFWVLLIIMLLLTVFINLNRSMPGQVYKAIFNENYLKYLQRSYTVDNRFLYLLFYVFFILNGGIFIFLNLRYFFGLSDLRVLLLCWIGLSVLYLVRHQFIRYISYVYPLEKTFGVLNFSILVYNVFLGMALLPINVIMAFSPGWLASLLLYAGLIMVLGLYAIRQMRAVVSSLSDIATYPLHFFLYLCACEIMPLLIVAKFLYQSSQ